MKKRELYLIGILLVLLGVILGQAISNYRINPEYKPLNNVQITELNRAKTPLFTDDDLAHLDARFLFNRIAMRLIKVYKASFFRFFSLQLMTKILS